MVITWHIARTAAGNTAGSGHRPEGRWPGAQHGNSATRNTNYHPGYGQADARQESLRPG
jgi:hypothetical protein